jgi:hypothetical protein
MPKQSHCSRGGFQLVPEGDTRPFFLFTEVWESDIVTKLSFLDNFKPYSSNAV